MRPRRVISFVLLVAGLGLALRERLVALLTKTTGTWIGTPPVTTATKGAAATNEAPAP